MNPPINPSPAGPAPLPETEPAGAVSLTRTGSVLHVRLNPTAQGDDVLNADVLDALIAVLDGLHEQPDIQILVLSSLGKDFCLGADRREYQNVLADDPTGTTLRLIADKAHRLCQALENTHAVTIARLHGGVIGAGLALASHCDLRAGADTCRFRMPEVGLGLAPAWGGAMARIITEAGAARIRELMFTCEEFNTSTAQHLGLLHKVTPLDGLDEAITAWTRPLSRRSPQALVLTKRMLAGYAIAARTSDIDLRDYDFQLPGPLSVLEEGT